MELTLEVFYSGFFSFLSMMYVIMDEEWRSGSFPTLYASKCKGDTNYIIAIGNKGILKLVRGANSTEL